MESTLGKDLTSSFHCVFFTRCFSSWHVHHFRDAIWMTFVTQL